MSKTETIVKFDCTPEEDRLIGKIQERYYSDRSNEDREDYDRVDMIMDLRACHANGTPINFEKLLAAPAFDFYHDIHGINRHLNRKTGKLENCFLPRCSR